MEKVPCVVIGAGAVGLAVGRAMSKAGIFTLVLERNPIFGAENSSRNSEVLHAGMYYSPGSLKASLCNEGKHKLLDYIKAKHVSINNCGKIIVASSENEVHVLKGIIRNGERNGLNNLRMLSQSDVKFLEPNVSCHAGILSPFTSVFDSHTLMMNYEADMEDEGSMVVYNCVVSGLIKLNKLTSNSSGRFELETSQGPLQCDMLVNAAGMYAPSIAAAMDFYPDSAIPPVYFAKGNYFKLHGTAAPFKRLVYPIPAAGGLGVHATIDLQGSVRFGPDVEWLAYNPHRKRITCASSSGSGRSGGSGKSEEALAGVELDPFRYPATATPPSDFRVNPLSVVPNSSTSGGAAGVSAESVQWEESVDVFCREIKRYWPAVRKEMLIPDYAGIRPKLCGPPPGTLVPPPTIELQQQQQQLEESGGLSQQLSYPRSFYSTHTISEENAGENSAAAGGGSGGAGVARKADDDASPTHVEYQMAASADFMVLGQKEHGVAGLVNLFGIESPGLTASLALGDKVRDMLVGFKRK